MDPKTLKGGKPVAWAAPGLSAGIGTEIGLACHRRFMADTPKARIGLPEILVGLFPGAGGTTRVSRMLGVMAAAPILLEGKMLPPKAAKAAGLIDEVVPPDDVIFALADRGRLGRKAKAGFYAYDEAGKRTGLWPGLGELWPLAAAQPPLAEVQHRLAMVQTLEAVRALEDGVLTDIREGDVGAILGWGYMPWSGGPFSWLDILGTGQAVAICDRLAAAHGDRFAPPKLLREMAEVGQTFYGRFAPVEKAA